MKLLLIEDNPGDARLIQEMLKEVPTSLAISVVEQLGQGLAFLSSQSVDVVLLDLNLPDSRGLDTFTSLRDRFPNLPVVIMTGIADEELGTRAVRLGAQDYLVKGKADGELLRRALVYARERKLAEQNIKYALKFEGMVSSLSSRFVASANVDSAINASLAEMGQLGKADRAYLFLLSQDGATMDNTHEWCAEGVNPQISNLKNLPTEMFPWWMAKLRSGEVMHIEDISKLPAEASAEKQMLESQDIKSLLVLPLYVQAKLAGFIGFDNVRGTGAWREESFSILRISAEIIGNALDRARTEDALYESRERFRRLSEAAFEGIAVIEDGKIMDANQTMSTMLQCDLSAIIGRSVLDFVAPEYHDLVRQNIASGYEQPYEVTCLREDGSAFPTEVCGKMVFYQGRMQRITASRDITRRRQAAELSRILVASSPVGIYIVQKGKFIYTNSKFQEDTGYSADELLGMESLSLVVPEYREMVRRNAIQMLNRRRTAPYEFQVTTRSGAVIWISEKVSSIQYEGKPATIGSFQDITERKQIETRLEPAASEWRTTFDSISDWVSVHNRDFQIVRANKAFARALKMKPEEIIGKFCYEVIHGENQPSQHCAHREALETRRPCRREFFNPHLQIHMEVVCSPVFNDKGEITTTVHVARDVTEQRKMEEQLMVTNRLVSLGELVAGIAHEVNNPLGSVLGLCQLLQDKELPADVREELGLMNQEAERAVRIVRNLLSFARKQPPEKQSVQINSIIQSVLDIRAYEQKVNNIEVQTSLASDLPSIVADAFQLQQVFFNLVINAEYFMLAAHGRGTLTVTTQRIGSIIRVSFADDGTGIPRENLTRVFAPFFTTKKVGQGTGLGLSICHGVVTDHGGRIYAESEPGRGATFIIELPLEILA